MTTTIFLPVLGSAILIALAGRLYLQQGSDSFASSEGGSNLALPSKKVPTEDPTNLPFGKQVLNHLEALRQNPKGPLSSLWFHVRSNSESQLGSKKKDMGGSTGGGGGDGIACFLDPATAEAAFETEGRLKTHALSDIKSLSVAEYWEYQTTENVFSLPRPGESEDSFTQRILDHWRPYGSYFFSKLDLSRKILDQYGVIQFTTVPLRKIDDTGPSRKPLPSNCRRIQIAERTQELGNFPNPQVSLKIDANLWNLLLKLNGDSIGTLNQALLKTHESIYLLGSALGQQKSEDTRKLVSFLFSETISKNFETTPRESRASLFWLWMDEFDFFNFVKLITLTPPFDDPSLTKIQARQKAFLSFSEKLSDFSTAYLKMMGVDFEQTDANQVLADTSLMQIMVQYLQLEMVPQLEPIEAYLYTAMMLQQFDRIPSFDRVLMEGQESYSIEVCTTIKGLDKRPLLYKFKGRGVDEGLSIALVTDLMRQKALEYCESQKSNK